VRGEFFEFLFRALPSAKLALVPEVLVDYRRHDGNDSGSSAQQFIGKWRVFELVHRNAAYGHLELMEQLRDDLPTRRVKACMTALEMGDQKAMREMVEAGSAGQLLSPKLRAVAHTMEVISKVPSPVFKLLSTTYNIVRGQTA
jgi:hypothetical protein